MKDEESSGQNGTGALLKKPEPAASPSALVIAQVRRKHGVGAFRQFGEIVRLLMGPGRVMPQEYFAAGLFDPTLSMAEKREFVGRWGNKKLNATLSPRKLARLSRLLSNKLLFTALLRQLGFATTETQALVADGIRLPTIPTLATADELQSFLRKQARYPLFGKPQASSGSFGSALLERLDGDDIVLGDGRKVALDVFCREVATEYGGGYLLQTALRQHPVLTAVIGQMIGSVRIVTVRPGDRPEPLYALWKMPAPDAMSDNFWQEGSMIAEVHRGTGVVGPCHAGSGLALRRVEAHPVSGQPVSGTQLPFWEEACELACDVHAIFPEFGVIGWDMAFTESGPVIIESNDNPFHTLYQQAFGRGVQNPDFTPVFERVAERSKAMLNQLS